MAHIYKCYMFTLINRNKHGFVGGTEYQRADEAFPKLPVLVLSCVCSSAEPRQPSHSSISRQSPGLCFALLWSPGDMQQSLLSSFVFPSLHFAG